MGEVVTLTEHTNGIVQVTMQDRQARNTFSPELIAGLKNAFEQIKRREEYKVVVIHGFDSYFCCGGTKEELMAIHNGELSFTDLDFFRLLLDCPLPVIAAMQGHALGGGLVFGLYADFIILGKENIYSANFMKYGFTPGMGGTFMVPYRFGRALGHELLYTAEAYRGAELKERGVSQRVVGKQDVIPEAFKLAAQLAEKPRPALMVLKAHLTSEIQEQLGGVIEKELQMHAQTFHTDEVASRIKNLF